MRVSNRRLFIPGAVLACLFAPGVSAATASSIPIPERITGIVETIIREQPPGQPADVIGTKVNDTSKVLRVGTQIVPLTDDSLPTTKDSTKVSVHGRSGR